MIFKKEKLHKYLEPFVYDQLTKSKYEVVSIEPRQLLTWNRLDLGLKLYYLDIHSSSPEQGLRVYREDIRAQTMGIFSELGNAEKNSLDIYEQEFLAIYESIKTSGFDANRTIIPLSSAGTIINGAHRVASAIHLNKAVTCVVTERNIMTCDYTYFYDRNVPAAIIEAAVIKFIEYTSNIYLAFLWPSGKKNLIAVEKLFNNVLYKKNITFSPKGAFNLIVELYKHMDWVGSTEAGYSGAKQKLLECFPTFDKVTVIAFQSKNIGRVKEIKKKVREINGIGFSSIHITDTKEEAIRIAQLIFNANGLHFLNYATPNRFPLQSIFEKFKSSLKKEEVPINDIVIDGSVILSLYGIRKNADLDFISAKNYKINGDFDNHQSEIKYHSSDKEDLVYSPDCHFHYHGLKFISFGALYEMKKRRGERKDINDLALMGAFIDGHKIRQYLWRARQILFYFKLKVNRKTRILFYQLLKATKLYVPIRYIYRRLRGRSL